MKACIYQSFITNGSALLVMYRGNRSECGKTIHAFFSELPSMLNLFLISNL